MQLSQAVLRKAVAAGLARADLDEIVPPAMRAAGPAEPARGACAACTSRRPDCDAAALEDRSHPAWQRLKFDELLAQQLSQLQAKRERERAARAGVRGASAAACTTRCCATLPFRADARRSAASPTRSPPTWRGRCRCIACCRATSAPARPWSRRSPPRVAIDAGWQCALMAPTEILAEQHLKKLVGWLAPLGVTVAWLTGSRKGKARTKMLEQVASGEAALVVGTHAVIEEQVRFARLGLAIVDEQHRFGVTQRLALRGKLAENDGESALEPHLLMMSATPIPRTLAMTLFADLDVSTIDELPPGPHADRDAGSSPTASATR